MSPNFDVIKKMNESFNMMELGREYKRIFRLAFPENHRASSKKWHNKNRARALLAMKAWERENRDRKLAQNSRWGRNNPEKRRASNAKRRALQLGSTVGDISSISKIYERAHVLRRWFDVVVDHIIPLCRGGRHSPDNLQIIYRAENGIKGSSLTYKPQIIFA